MVTWRSRPRDRGLFLPLRTGLARLLLLLFSLTPRFNEVTDTHQRYNRFSGFFCAERSKPLKRFPMTESC